MIIILPAKQLSQQDIGFLKHTRKTVRIHTAKCCGDWLDLATKLEESPMGVTLIQIQKCSGKDRLLCGTTSCQTHLVSGNTGFTLEAYLATVLMCGRGGM